DHIDVVAALEAPLLVALVRTLVGDQNSELVSAVRHLYARAAYRRCVVVELVHRRVILRQRIRRIVARHGRTAEVVMRDVTVVRHIVHRTFAPTRTRPRRAHRAVGARLTATAAVVYVRLRIHTRPPARRHAGPARAHARAARRARGARLTAAAAVRAVGL